VQEQRFDVVTRARHGGAEQAFDARRGRVDDVTRLRRVAMERCGADVTALVLEEDAAIV
jgi:hypothetical protein